MATTILVIDDDPNIVHLLKEDLESEGYKVLEGFDGQMALSLARAQKPKLIVMDVNMPAISGPKALEFLRGAAETKNIPVIFLTGEASGHVAHSLNGDSRVTHLQKPIDLDHLNTTVRQFIEKYPT